MNDSYSQSVSVLQPVEPAMERMKEILFRPFDFEKWILIGFCAWLAGLIGGGSNYAFGNSYEEQEKPSLHHGLGELQDFILKNLSWLLPVVALVAILVIALVILLLWLSSRGQFMFLHCVALNQAEVSVPWRKFRQEASSLWRVSHGACPPVACKCGIFHDGTGLGSLELP